MRKAERYDVSLLRLMNRASSAVSSVDIARDVLAAALSHSSPFARFNGRTTRTADREKFFPLTLRVRKEPRSAYRSPRVRVDLFVPSRRRSRRHRSTTEEPSRSRTRGSFVRPIARASWTRATPRRSSRAPLLERRRPGRERALGQTRGQHRRRSSQCGRAARSTRVTSWCPQP